MVAAPRCLRFEASQQGKLTFHLRCPAVKSKSACTYADREAESFLQRLLTRLPTPSQFAARPSETIRAKDATVSENGELLDHRPHQQLGPPLEILSEAFAKCADLMRSAVPRQKDCEAACGLVDVASRVAPLPAHCFNSYMLTPSFPQADPPGTLFMASTHVCTWQPTVAAPCVVMLQVVVYEAKQLHEPILHIFREWLGDKVHFQFRPASSVPDIMGTVGQRTVLMVELKADSGGNARFELLVRRSPCQSYLLSFVHCFLALQLHRHLCACGRRPSYAMHM